MTESGFKMADWLEFDPKKRLEKFVKTAPKVYGRAMAVMMTEMAFEMKNKQIVFHMQRRTPMNIRDEKFAKGRLKVQKAKPRSNVNLIYSKVGSVADKPRFTGWLEQQSGKKADKSRTFSLRARKGNRKRKALPTARLKPGRSYPTPSDFGLNRTAYRSRRALTKAGLAKAALVWTRRERYRRPFVLLGHDRIEDGLFRWQGKRLVRLQYFDVANRAQPKKVRWMEGATRIYMRGLGDAGRLRLFNKAVKRVSNWR